MSFRLRLLAKTACHISKEIWLRGVFVMLLAGTIKVHDNVEGGIIGDKRAVNGGLFWL